MEVIRIYLAEELGTKKDANISLNYQRLHTLLDTLTNFFHVGGQGLELSMMQGKDFLVRIGLSGFFLFVCFIFVFKLKNNF